MAEPVPAGSDVSAGTYRCTSCGNTIDLGSTITVRNPWHTDGGGNSDGANDGYVTLSAAQFYSGFDYARAAQA